MDISSHVDALSANAHDGTVIDTIRARMNLTPLDQQTKGSEVVKSVDKNPSLYMDSSGTAATKNTFKKVGN